MDKRTRRAQEVLDDLGGCASAELRLATLLIYGDRRERDGAFDALARVDDRLVATIKAFSEAKRGARSAVERAIAQAAEDALRDVMRWLRDQPPTIESEVADEEAERDRLAALRKEADRG